MKWRFQDLKKHLASLPLLSKLITRDPLFLYLAVSESAVSGALVPEEGDIQKPVYYINKSMIGTETRYQRMEKMVLTLFVISRKLKYNF